MEAHKTPRLLQQAEKILLQPIHPHLISYCPTMDLIGVVTSEESLDVYRINGQRAFGVKRKNDGVAVDIVQWEFSGKKVCVGWSDGSLEVVSTETGKRLRLEEGVGRQKGKDDGGVEEEKSRFTCIGWGLNFIDVESVKKRLGMRKRRESDDIDGRRVEFRDETTEAWDAFKDDTTVEDFLVRQPDLQALDVSPDLPDQLAMMDVEVLLPKLPLIPLPPATPFMRFGQQQDAGTFGTQAEVDSLLQSNHLKEHNSVDMFVRCTNQGTIYPSMYDSAETVDIRLPSSWNIDNSKPLLHASHPYSCSHGLLTEIKRTDQKTKLAFIPLTLGFIPSAGIYLHLIASKTSQLQSLLLYVQQCLQRVRTYWKHSRDLPGKFIMNISESLEEKNQGDLVQGLYHLACTGSCPPLIREWLVDELQEAGHKRWDTTVATALTTLLQLLHENLLPAIDRCTIILVRLRGLAAYHDSGWIFNTPVNDFSALLEQLKNLRLLAHTALVYANDEKRQFHSFSKWLRYEIDYEATEPDSQSRAEMDARDPGVDIGVVLEYIRYGLVRSDLAPYLRAEDDLGAENKEKERSSYEDTRKAVDLLKEEASYKEEALCLDHVLRHFKEGCTKLFQQISLWQESEIRMDCGIVLEEGEVGETRDMRMVVDHTQQTTNVLTHIALASPSATSDLHIHRLSHGSLITSLPKDLQKYAITTLRFQDAAVLDAKFADDVTLLILLRLDDEEKTCLIMYLPYSPTSPGDVISYTSISHSSYAATFLPAGSPVRPSSREILTISHKTVEKHTRHVFEGRFTPLKLVVNGRKGRRVVVVLGSDRKHYRVLDLDFKEGKAKGKTRHGRESGGAEVDEDLEEAMHSSSSESDGDFDVDMIGA